MLSKVFVREDVGDGWFPKRAVGFDDGCGGGPGVCACCCGAIALFEACLPLSGRLIPPRGWTDVPGPVLYELERPTASTPCVHGYLLCALPLRRLRWSQPRIGDTSLAEVVPFQRLPGEKREPNRAVELLWRLSRQGWMRRVWNEGAGLYSMKEAGVLSDSSLDRSVILVE